MKEVWNKYIARRTDNTFIQFFRYLFVGGFAFIIDYAASIIAVRVFDIYEVYATIISFILGLTANYTLSTLWIFRQRRITKQSYDFMAFGLIGLTGLLLKAALVWFLTEVPQMIIEFSNPIATVVLFIWNFLARKYLLYNKKSTGE